MQAKIGKHFLTRLPYEEEENDMTDQKTPPLYLGAHLSVAKGMKKMVEQAVSIKANTCQFFTRNPRGGPSKKVDLEDRDQAKALMKAHYFGPLVAHAPYIVNPASPDEKVRQNTVKILIEDLAKISELGVPYLVVHPGSHKGEGAHLGIERSAAVIAEVLDQTDSGVILWETMSGMGSEIGGTMEELEELLTKLSGHKRIGFCLDTCHMFTGGYPVHESFQEIIKEFGKRLGKDRLLAVHLNDCLQPFASQKDRHANLGEGLIGWRALEDILKELRPLGLPINLETPGGVDNYAEEIKEIRGRLKIPYENEQDREGSL